MSELPPYSGSEELSILDDTYWGRLTTDPMLSHLPGANAKPRHLLLSATGLISHPRIGITKTDLEAAISWLREFSVL